MSIYLTSKICDPFRGTMIQKTPPGDAAEEKGRVPLQTGFSAGFGAAQLRGSSEATGWRAVFLKAKARCGVGLLVSWCLDVRVPRVSPYLQPQDLSPSAAKPPR